MHFSSLLRGLRGGKIPLICDKLWFKFSCIAEQGFNKNRLRQRNGQRDKKDKETVCTECQYILRRN